MSAPRKPPLAELVESFFQNRLLRQQRASSATVAAYQDALRLLLSFVAALTSTQPCLLTVADLERDRVLAFLDYLEKTRGNSVRTRNARLAAIRSFFQHVACCDPPSMGVAQRVLAIPSKRTVKRTLGYLLPQELDAVLATPDRLTPNGRRDYTLLLFLARTGARVSEAIGVTVRDLRLDHPCQVLLRGKGAKERVVPLGKDTVRVLREHCAEHGFAPGTATPIFVSARGTRLTRHGVIHLLHRAVGVAARTLPSLASRSISPHTFRHTCAMYLLQAGVDLSTIRSWLGHVSIDTTHQYLEADVEMKRRALEMSGVTEPRSRAYRPPDALLALLKRRLELCDPVPPADR